MFAILSSWVLSLSVCPHISSRNLFKASRGQTCLPLITWGRGDGCDRRGDDAAGVECGELLHLNRRHRGNRREVGRLSHQGLLLHQLQGGQRHVMLRGRRQGVKLRDTQTFFQFVDAQLMRSRSWCIGWSRKKKKKKNKKRSKRINTVFSGI